MILMLFNQIKQRFAGTDDSVYTKFVQNLEDHSQGKKTVLQVHASVAELLKGHPDLQADFEKLLPELWTYLLVIHSGPPS